MSNNKSGYINNSLAVKVVDNVLDLIELAEKDPKLSENIRIDRAAIAESIASMSRRRITGKITLNFDKQGNIYPEVNLQGQAVLDLLREKRI